MAHDLVPELLRRATEALEQQFAYLQGQEAAMGRGSESAVGADAMERVLEATAQRLADNYPYFHPLYAGQMLKPPHPVARAAYALAMTINPNNHARDGGRASSDMEVEAVREIASVFGWAQDRYLGHLTSSGTLANLEALWMAGQLAPGKRIVGSEQAHYTHRRISGVLRLDYAAIAADNRGRMDPEALESELRKGDVGAIVVTLGTTAIGAVDPLDEILALRERYSFRVHVDAAYGGYFGLIADELGEPARRAYAAAGQADSIVIDPHKHGLQPYGCGCVLFRDPALARFYKHESPYTYFTSKNPPLHPSEENSFAGRPVHLGEISLECSRAGAAAVALWATQRLLPLVPGGEFARGLSCGRKAARELHQRLRNDPRFETMASGGTKLNLEREPELDIVVWKVKAESAERASALAREIFDRCAAKHLHLALVQLPHSWFENLAGARNQGGLVTCLRSVLMKTEHEAWLDRIWDRRQVTKPP
jgi:glutamate/tyrosine decarboxylase-like PLP-dependent enzyme